jgi:hypothetical protein
MKNIAKEVSFVHREEIEHNPFNTPIDSWPTDMSQYSKKKEEFPIGLALGVTGALIVGAIVGPLVVVAGGIAAGVLVFVAD